jgi:hypothetical protein
MTTLSLPRSVVLVTFALIAGCDSPPANSDGTTASNDAQLGQAVARHLALASGEQTVDRGNYQRSLQELRKQPRATVNALMPIYRKLPASSHQDRWLVAHELAALRRPEALNGLLEIAKAPLPVQAMSVAHPETPERAHTVRARAVEGIALLARDGDRGAEQALATLVRSGDPPLQLAAARAWLTSGPQAARRTTLRGLLEPRDRWIADVRLVRVEDIPAEKSGPATSPTPGARP